MMIPSQSYFFSGIVVTLFFFLLSSFVLQTLASPKLPHCRHDQRDALLEIKKEFPGADMTFWSDHDMSSWNKSSDCCSWGAVMCDGNGQVISLNLSYVTLNNTLKPNSGLFKLQYLQNLTLLESNLYGEIPYSFENLSHLSRLDLSYNNFVGKIPASFGNLSRLMSLDLSFNALVGQLPASIGNLTKLTYLDLRHNNFIGKIPVSFANLTKMVTLGLDGNYFEPQLLPDISRFHNLEKFGGSGNLFFGHFPTSLFTIPSLQLVILEGNEFKGPIDFGNMSSPSRLWFLFLANTKFNGPIPESISKFLNLVYVDLSKSSFSGPFPTSLFTIPSLQVVDLGRNQFEGPIDFGIQSSSSKLSVLDLSNNKLEGKVPGCLWKLASLKLSHNSFSSFEKSYEVLDQSQMLELRLDSNSFVGSFFHGICKLRSLKILDLSNNSFNGSIPPCLTNLNDSIEVFILRNNNFSGILPHVFANATNLLALDISRNRLEGKLPKSLINCTSMIFLNVGENKFKDKFPHWLGSLQWLNILILRSNQFFGPLYRLRHVSIGFQKLKVIDVSHNDFSGSFPTFYFSSWFGMSQMTTVFEDGYVEYSIHITASESFAMESGSYDGSMDIVHKGVDTEFEKIRRDFRVIDFSRNKFYGKIPESIGLLKGLRSLNLSNNAFTSNIPQSLANLTNLESLDLSQNQLSGQIPKDLGALSSISTMNFSHNNLQGPIPRGTQFQSQNCSSFMGNPKLYGLEEICGKPHVPNLTPQESEEVSEPEEQVINWIAAAIAFGPGVFCGLVIGYIYVSHYHERFMVTFHRYKRRVVNRSAR